MAPLICRMESFRRRIPRWIVLAVMLVGLVVLARQFLPPGNPLLHAAASSKAPGRRELPVARGTPIDHRATWRSVPPGAPELRVGLLLKNIDNLQLESQTFSAEGWYWLEWGDNLERIRRDQNLKPEPLVEFANQSKPGIPGLNLRRLMASSVPMAVTMSCFVFRLVSASMQVMKDIPPSKRWCCRS